MYWVSFLKASSGGRLSSQHHCPVMAVGCPLPANYVSALIDLRAKPVCLLTDTDQEAGGGRGGSQRETGRKGGTAWLTKSPDRFGTDDLTPTATGQGRRERAQGLSRWRSSLATRWGKDQKQPFPQSRDGKPSPRGGHQLPRPRPPRSWTAHPTIQLQTNAKGAWEQEPAPRSMGPCWAVCACQMPVFTPVVTHLFRLHATALQSPLWAHAPRERHGASEGSRATGSCDGPAGKHPSRGESDHRRPSCDYRGFSLPKDVIQFHGYLGL